MNKLNSFLERLQHLNNKKEITFGHAYKYSVYNNKLEQVKFLDLINNIKSLDGTNNKTIGNFFLIKDLSFVYSVLLAK